MATEQRRTEPDLAWILERQFPGQDDLFQLIRIAERLHRHAGGEVAPVGNDGPPAREALRFEAAATSAFTAGSVEGILPAEGTGRATRVTVNLPALTGPAGVLPQHYSTLVQQRLRKKDRALADFLNLFNHRLISLYYRAWARHQPAVMEEQFAQGQSSPFTTAIQALAGARSRQHGDTALYYSGHFSRPTRSAAALRRMLEDFLGHAVEVEPFVGQWLPIPRDQRFQLGKPAAESGLRLGDGVLTGRRVWDVQSRVRIHIGPVSGEEHEALLPSGSRYRSLCRLLRAYLPAHLTVELRYTITNGGKASKQRALGQGARLGWTTWSSSRRGGLRYATHLLPAQTSAGSIDTSNRED